MKVRLVDIAYGRSGDKGNHCNIGIIAKLDSDYVRIQKGLTAEIVKQQLAFTGVTRVERYELPNIGALNFVLYNALDGGGTTSLRTDSQGKTLAAALLRIELDL